MNVKRSGLLHGELSKIVARLGHGQSIAIADYGLPIPTHIPVIDLAVAPNMPPLLSVLQAISSELDVESLIVAEELANTLPQFLEEIVHIFPTNMVKVPHDMLKQKLHDVVAVVRTGEWTPYANVILTAGVVF
ncbi:MAG: D-ribose pyranase [Acidibacillus sp.]|uniref:D-ribose pyranase n=1 Tax=Sulfoacidibacillus ferrooxidans TaxID=2005001 RepID=A0A9X2ADQ2_9BACL|nr:D-ribose pyranase [Sulfoacidibacillus ferrooxidans]MCI0182547.1 D-ribose pyranase [Sulfoacidibacillus ferrooxidans]MCY0894181.1 D-ribose pyranase [Acidibacillus sp.]